MRSLRQVGDLTSFQSFLRALAARTGQLLNLSDIARDLGIALNTAKAWLSVLEATFQVIVPRPYHANIGKRLRRTGSKARAMYRWLMSVYLQLCITNAELQVVQPRGKRSGCWPICWE